MPYKTKGIKMNSSDKAIPQNYVGAFQIGPDGETDIVATETLLMNLAMAESVISDMTRFMEATEKNGGTAPDDVVGPDQWAVAGMFQNLHAVVHALKCGCWGYETAYMR